MGRQLKIPTLKRWKDIKCVDFEFYSSLIPPCNAMFLVSFCVLIWFVLEGTVFHLLHFLHTLFRRKDGLLLDLGGGHILMPIFRFVLFCREKQGLIVMTIHCLCY
jgi:hypothetical protein